MRGRLIVLVVGPGHAVVLGSVRCARGAACRFAEDGVGGLIGPGQLWDLGHADGELVGARSTDLVTGRRRSG